MECSPDLLELVGSEVMECVRRQQEVGTRVVCHVYHHVYCATCHVYHVQVGRGAGQQFPQAGVWAQEAVCVMVARMVTKCGAMWRNCYSDTEVRALNH